MDRTQAQEINECLDDITAAAIAEARETGQLTKAGLRPIHKQKIMVFIQERYLDIPEWRVDMYLGHTYGNASERQLTQEAVERLAKKASLQKTYIIGGLTPRPVVSAAYQL